MGSPLITTLAPGPVPQYPTDELVRLFVQFFDPLHADAPVDPTTVTITITPPNGLAPVVADLTDGVVRDGVGAYHYDFLVAVQGQHIFRWQSGGIVIASSGNCFFLAV